MNSLQIMLIRSSFDHLAPDADLLADLLCARLFQLDPSLRLLLPNDLTGHKQDKLRLLSGIVQDLDQPQRWEPALREFGNRSAHSGIQPQHYDTFGTALIWTLEKGLGEQFTFDILGAWVVLYTHVAETMQSSGGLTDSSSPIPLV